METSANELEEEDDVEEDESEEEEGTAVNDMDLLENPELEDDVTMSLAEDVKRCKVCIITSSQSAKY